MTCEGAADNRRGYECPERVGAENPVRRSDWGFTQAGDLGEYPCGDDTRRYTRRRSLRGGPYRRESRGRAPRNPARSTGPRLWRCASSATATVFGSDEFSPSIVAADTGELPHERVGGFPCRASGRASLGILPVWLVNGYGVAGDRHRLARGSAQRPRRGQRSRRSRIVDSMAMTLCCSTTRASSRCARQGPWIGGSRETWCRASGSVPRLASCSEPCWVWARP